MLLFAAINSKPCRESHGKEANSPNNGTRLPSHKNHWADLAYALDETPQIVYNWERRGISKLVLSKYPINLILMSAGFLLERVHHPLIVLEIKITTDTKRGGWVPVKSYSKMGMDGYYTEMGYLGNGGDGYVPLLRQGQMLTL